MALEEIQRGEYIDTDEVEEEPNCIRLEPDQVAAFRGFLMPRLESARDEASMEILAAVRGGRNLGDAVNDVLESLPARKTQRLRQWLKEVSGTRIYAYVVFHSLFRLSFGLTMTAGGPRDREIASEEIGSWELENSVAPYWEFRDAFKEMGDAHAFDEISLVEVSDEEEYDEALAAMGIEPGDGAWERAGLYDFSMDPPSYSGTVDAYERESMKDEAVRALEGMFDGDEWRSACVELLER
jgi:hypothetical protein